MKTIDEIREYLYSKGYGEDEDSEVILFDAPDYATAFVGMSDDGRAIYDHSKMVDFLVQHDGMTPPEAIEFIDYNIIGFRSEKQPIILYPIPSEEA